jgi:hypothetical protein
MRTLETEEKPRNVCVCMLVLATYVGVPPFRRFEPSTGIF